MQSPLVRNHRAISPQNSHRAVSPTMRTLSPHTVQRNPSPPMVQRPVATMPVRRVTPTSIDMQVWDTVRTFEPVMAATSKKLTELALSNKDMREKYTQLREDYATQQQSYKDLSESFMDLRESNADLSQRHADLQEYSCALQQSHEDLKSAYEAMDKRHAESVDALVARVVALEARSSGRCFVVNEQDEVAPATAKPEPSPCGEETVQRKWVDIPPPLPQDLGRTPPRTNRDLTVLEMKTPAEQENGPGNITIVKKRTGGNVRSLRTAPGPMHPVDYEARVSSGLSTSSCWLRQNFSVPRY